MKDIKNRTRVKLDSKFAEFLGLKWWHRWELCNYVEKYELKYTTRRYNTYYFKPQNKEKLALFMLTYGEFVRN
jgi:hypothetical protein